MKRLLLIGLGIFLVYYFVNFSTITVFADDDHEKYENKYEEEYEENETIEDLGEVLGWGAIAVGLFAGFLFPLRRGAKFLLTQFPSIKSIWIKFLKQMGKLHIPLGLLSILLGLFHGLFMYFNEGNLGLHEWIGIAGISLMGIASLFGVALWMNKAKIMRIIHISFLSFAGIAIIIHIGIS